MFIIEYMQLGELKTMRASSEVEARAKERFLVSLFTVGLVIVWGPI